MLLRLVSKDCQLMGTHGGLCLVILQQLTFSRLRIKRAFQIVDSRTSFSASCQAMEELVGRLASVADTLQAGLAGVSRDCLQQCTV